MKLTCNIASYINTWYYLGSSWQSLCGIRGPLGSPDHHRHHLLCRDIHRRQVSACQRCIPPMGKS